MPTFVALISWTDQGIRSVKETTKRHRVLTRQLDKMGVKERAFFWTVGRYDAIAIYDSPDEETASAAMLAVGSGGNVRTETMRAYSAAEMDKVLRKIP